MLDPRVFTNPAAAEYRAPGPAGDPLALHRLLPGYAPTRLAEALGLARELGLGQVWVKDESERMGLPAFKILGAAWATTRALLRQLGRAELGLSLIHIRRQGRSAHRDRPPGTARWRASRGGRPHRSQ